MEENANIMTENVDPMDVAIEMAHSISKMYEDRDAKALQARDRLSQQLHMTAQKYMTANGVIKALMTVRDVTGSEHKGRTLTDEITMAKMAAKNLASIADEMADRIIRTDPELLGSVFDDAFQSDFVGKRTSVAEFVEQLMILDLCQMAGPNAEDIADFIRHADEEIEKSRDALREHCEANGIDFNELCGPHEDCHDCLYYSCAKDCKSDKQIMEGQSAYDMCEDFVESE